MASTDLLDTTVLAFWCVTDKEAAELQRTLRHARPWPELIQRNSQVPDVTITIPSGTAIGRTVDAKLGAVPARVTLLSERTLRIEPDDVCTIMTAITEDGRTTICAVGGRRPA